MRTPSQPSARNDLTFAIGAGGAFHQPAPDRVERLLAARGKAVAATGCPIRIITPAIGGARGSLDNPLAFVGLRDAQFGG